MLMLMIMEEHPEREVVGRDAQSAFNTLGTDHTARILEGKGWLRDWIVDWLAPRQSNIEVDGKSLGTTVMAGGTPQGSPLLPKLFTI